MRGLSEEQDYGSRPSERVLQRCMGVQSQMIERVPGIAPYLARVMETSGLTRQGISPLFDNLLEVVEKFSPESSP